MLGSLSKAEEAAQFLARKWSNAKRRMATGTPSWEKLETLEETEQRLRSLVALFECQMEVSRQVNGSKARAWVEHWHEWMGKMSASVSKGQVGKQVRTLRRKARTAQQKRKLELFLDGSQFLPWMDKGLRTQELEQYKRDEDYAREQERFGGVVLYGEVEGIHRDYLLAAKKSARMRGLKGRLFKPWSEESNAALSYANFNELRRLIWQAESHAPVPMTAVEKMRRARNALAQARGKESHAELLFSEHMVYSRPWQLVKEIQRTRQQLARERRSLFNAARQLVKAQGHDLPDGELAPWDAHFVLAQAQTAPHPDVTGVFPWKETSLKAIPELLAQCGWSLVAAPKLSGKGVWSVIHFHIECINTGQRSHLLYAPFRPRHKGHSYFAGVAVDVINRWSARGAGTRENTVWITQDLDVHSQGFSLEDLRVLCHELGHALHFSAMPGHTANELNRFPEDMIELPSYLLELYCRDPVVLARWASKKGPPSAKRARFWKPKLAWPATVVSDHLDFLRSAQLDLVAHLDTQRSFQELAEETLAFEGDRIYPEDDSWKRLFIWNTDLAGIDFTQSLPQSVVRRLITVPDHGAISSTVVASTYRSLIDEVLVACDTPQKAAQRWRRWAGESFATSLKLSLADHARQSARITRRETQRLKKKLKARQAARRAR